MKTNQTKNQHNQCIAGLIALSVLFAVSSAQAATQRTWNGSGTDNNWTTSGNWVGSTAPGTNATDGLLFDGSTRQNNTNNFTAINLVNAGTQNRAIYFNTGGWILNGNPVTVGGAIGNTAGTNLINMNLVLTGTRSFYIADGQVTVNGVISGAYGLATATPSTASSFLVLGGSNTFSGGLTINSGAANVRVTNPRALGTGTVSIPRGGTSNGYLQLALTGSNTITNTFAGFSSGTGGATAVPTIENVSGSNTLTSPLIVTGSGGNGLMIESDSGLLMLNGPVGTTIASRYVQFYGAGDGLVNGPITNGTAGSFPVNKWGSGTWTLNGTNNFTGAVTINAGTVALGATGSISNSPAVNIGSGTVFDVSAMAGGWTLNSGQTIQGGGTVLGSVATAATNTTLQPGNISSPSTTVGTLVFSNDLAINNTTLRFNLSSDPAGTIHPSDQIDVGGNFSAAGTNTVVLGSYVNGFIANGTYTLIKFSGALTGDAGNFAVTNFTASGRGLQGGYIITNTGEIDLVVTGTPPANLVWAGDGVNNYWDITSSSNWLNGASLDEYYDNDSVTFDDTTNNYSVYILSTVTPGSVTVNTTNNNYNISGADISGFTGFTKHGSGTVTVSSYNTFTGTTTYGGGSIAVAAIGNAGTASPVGKGAQYLNGGALEYTGGGESNDRGFTIGSNGGTVAVDVPGVTLTFNKSGMWTSGGNTFTKTGPGTLAFSFQQDLSGTNIIAGGILKIPTVGLFGTDMTTPVFVGGGALDVNGQSMSTKPVVVSGVGDLSIDGNTNGAIINTGGSQLNALQFVTLTADAAFGGTTRWDIRANPTATLSTGGSARNLYKVGANQVSLVGVTVDSMLGDIDVRAGTLSYELGTTGLGNPAGTLAVENGATFDLYAATTALDKQIVLYDGSTLSDSSGSSTIIGPVNMPGDAFYGPSIAVAAGATLNLDGVVGGPGILTKTGNGILVLAATNTYSGLTYVNAGELRISSASINTADITVADGATLGAIVSGTNQLSPGNLTFGYGSGAVTNTYTGLASTTTAPLNPGNLYLNDPVTVNILSGSLVAGQNYPLIAFGTISGAGGLVLGSLPIGVSANLVTNGNTIELSVTSVVLNDIWSGAVNTNWDIGATANWQVNGASGTYAEGAIVQFDDSASNTTVFVTTTVSPGSVTVSNVLKNYVISGSAVSGSASLTKQGGGPLTLSSANSYSGGTTLSAGTLNINHASALGAAASALTITGGAIDNTSGGDITLANDHAQNWNGNFTFNGSQNLNLGAGAVTLNASRQVTVNAGTLTEGGVIDDGGSGYGLTKAGGGTLALTAANTYGGNTTISAGTLALNGGNNRLPAATTVNFSGAGTLDVGGVSQTVTSLTVADGATGASVGSGGTLAVNGGAFRVGNASASGTATLNLAGLSSFVYTNPSGVFDVGGQYSGSGSVNAYGNLYLATNTIITASQFGIGDNSSSYSGTSYCTGAVWMAQSTVINANTIQLGINVSRSAPAGFLGFQNGVSNPSLTIRAADGVSRVPDTIILGNIRYSSYPNYARGTIDLTNGVVGASTLDALVGTMIVGQHNYASGTVPVTGNFLMGGGILDATNIIVAQKTSTSAGTAPVTGTFELAGGTVKTDTLTVGDQQNAAGPVAATFNMDSGTVRAQTIAAGAGAPTATFNWNSGTIANYDASTDLTEGSSLTLTLPGTGTNIFSVDASRTATINGILSGSSLALTKTGNGTLVLNGFNSYSGPTVVNAGKMQVNGSLLTYQPFTVNPGAALGGAGTVSDVTITNGGAIEGGNDAGGTLTVSGALNLGANSTGASFSRFTIATAGMVSASTLNVNGTNTVEILDPSLSVGTNTLFTYSGTIGGSSGFGGFKLGTLPAGVTANLLDTGSAVQLAVTSVTAVNTNSPVLVNSVSGGTLTLSWPADHLGWRLEVQTNTLSAGLGTNWFTWPNSTNVTSVPIAVNPANPTTFFRLVYP